MKPTETKQLKALLLTAAVTACISACSARGPADTSDAPSNNTPQTAETEPTETPAAEQEPAAPVDVKPVWYLGEVQKTRIGHYLVPGTADDPNLIVARQNAIKDARTNAAIAGVRDADYDQNVLHFASARLDNGAYRVWIVYEYTPNS